MIKKASVRVCAALLALMLIAASLMTAFADIQSHMDDTAAVFTNPEQYSTPTITSIKTAFRATRCCMFTTQAPRKARF